MKVYLMHHANALTAEQDPDRHLSEQGVQESERMGRFMKAQGAMPAPVPRLRVEHLPPVRPTTSHGYSSKDVRPDRGVVQASIISCSAWERWRV